MRLFIALTFVALAVWTVAALRLFEAIRLFV